MCEGKEVQISIIIPVYNTPKKYFEKCIESIVCTEYPFYEIIVVDDGSTENNSEEYRAISLKYEKISYCRKENGGVSSARNQGVRIAKGKYVAFVDADDVVTPNFLLEAASLAEKYNSDVIIGTMKYENKPWFPQGVDEELYLPVDKIGSLKKCFLEISQIDIPYKVIGTPCGRLYRRSIVLEILFSENITHLEDQLFNRKLFDSIETAVLVPNLWYLYNQNEFSAMHSALPGKYLEKLAPFFEAWETMNEQEKDVEIRIGARVRSIVMFYGAVNDIILQENLPFFDRIKEIEALYNYKIFSNLVKELPMNCRISKYEKLKLFLIKHKMKYVMYFLVYGRRKIRKIEGSL